MRQRSVAFFNPQSDGHKSFYGILKNQHRNADDKQNNTYDTVKNFGCRPVRYLRGDESENECRGNAYAKVKEIRRSVYDKMTEGACEGGERHHKDAGTNSCLELVAEHRGEDHQHHHTAARTDKSADETDKRS